MKKSVICLICITFALSCTKSFVEIEQPVTLSKILLKGDYVDLSVKPLTKSASSQYYAFEVHEVNIKKCYEPPGDYYWYDTTYVHYAGGVFDNIKNIAISLETGKKYCIRCSIIEDREEHLYVDGNRCVYEPFVSSGHGQGTKAQINNTFLYNEQQEVFAYSSASYIRTIEDETNFAARVNRFYGEVFTDVIADNTPIILKMERRNYGIHFVINPPQEGELKVYQTYTSPKFDYVLNKESSSINKEYVYALDSKEQWSELDIKVKWTREDGSVVDLSPGKTKFYNKTMTTLKVDVNDRAGSSDIEINYDSEMTKEEIVIK